jgi:Ca2+-binding RTX toxin-like protein
VSREAGILAAVFGAGLVLAPVAAAGVVSAGNLAVTFEAATGEANVVTVTSSGAVVSVSDQGAPLVAGPGCQQVGVAAAVCPAPGNRQNFELIVRLGDQADSASLDAGWELSGHDSVGVVWIHAFGGPGADSLSLAGTNAGTVVDAGSGDDAVVGGRRSDTITPGPGNDVVEARGANDYVEEGPGNDRIDGGTGRDWVSYHATRRPVVGDLGRGRVTGAGRDRLQKVENLGGTRFADVLRGDAVRNHLIGGSGDDLLIGRGARDVLGNHEAEKGDDRLLGGPGDDALYAAGGDDLLVGGPGFDTFRAGTGADTLLARDGERDRGNAGDGVDRARLDSSLDRLEGLEATF